MDDASGGHRHPIAYLHVLRSADEEERRLRVMCPRFAESVDVSKCARCPRFIKVTPGQHEGDEAVHCHAEEVASADRPLSLQRTTVAELMDRDVTCVRGDLDLDVLLARFARASTSAVVIVDEAECLLGFVSQRDASLAASLRDGVFVGAERKLTVSDLPLQPAIVVPETTSVTQAAAVMAFEAQSRLVVTSSSGALVGVLSACDLMHWLARHDGHLLPPTHGCRSRSAPPR